LNFAIAIASTLAVGRPARTITLACKIGCRAVLLLLIAVLFSNCRRSETNSLLQPSQALGTVLAEEVARLAGANKRIAIIRPDAKWGGISTAEQLFTAELQKRHFEAMAALPVNVGNPMRRGPIGLGEEDFVNALQKSGSAAAIVSFAGAPQLKSADSTGPGSKHPPVIVVATASLGNVAGVWSDPVQLAALLEADVIQSAIIDNPEPQSRSAKGDATHALFDQHFRILHRMK
jgi:hypothetical protein